MLNLDNNKIGTLVTESYFKVCDYQQLTEAEMLHQDVFWKSLI